MKGDFSISRNFSKGEKQFVKYIVWDWNGTLFNDVDLCIKSMNQLLEKYGIAPIVNTIDYQSKFCFPVEQYYQNVGFDFIKTNNRIKFIIGNSGEAPVEKVKVRISYFSKGLLRDTEHQGTIAYLEGDSEETLNRPLFRFTALEFLSALYNFAGIEYINITVDPEGKYNEENTDDNTVSYPVEYEDIFPVLKGLEQIFL